MMIFVFTCPASGDKFYRNRKNFDSSNCINLREFLVLFTILSNTNAQVEFIKSCALSAHY